MEDNRTFIAIDLKSFYASVECVERDLDPLKTNLVVADKSRTEKTICLAVSPSLKKYGIPGRVRLFEVVDKVKQINALRRTENNIKEFKGTSYKDDELDINKDLAIDYIVAPPRMALYMDYSTRTRFDVPKVNIYLVSGDTGISNLRARENQNVIYDLQGRSQGKDLNTLNKGIYIIGGKKVVK